ncbi:MAG: hypothetical protein SVR08_16050 [Spirochaetota bacterium]|nr:hypothetical protein [Spirochaetota bacterium]
MTKYSQVKIGKYGELWEEITTIHFKYWRLTGDLIKVLEHIKEDE